MKYPEFVGLKLPADLVDAAKQQAEADDRSLSSYLRRIIRDAVQNAPTRSDKSESKVVGRV